MKFVSTQALVAYIVGVALGATFVILLVRKIGRKSQKSIVWAEIFRKVTKHRATVYNISRQPYNVSVTVEGDGDDYQNLMDILTRQLHFPKSSAEEASKHALKIAKDKPLQDKVTEALKYLDSTKNGLFGK
jgi:aspartokinase